MRLFGKESISRKVENENINYTDAYEDISHISFTSIFANALANKATTDSTITVKDANGESDSRRSEWITDGIDVVWDSKKKTVSQALGKGGKVLVPYVTDGMPFVDIIDQSRMRITKLKGNEIVSATLLAEITKKNDKVYYRWMDYTLENGTHTIITRATDENGGLVPLTIIPEWENIQEEITINNVEHILFGFLKCPLDNRKDDSWYGVPITYGSEPIIKELHECMIEMAREYKLKETFVGADERMFGKNNRLVDNGLFKKFSGNGSLNGDDFWEVFSPEIRDSAYFNRFEMLCRQLEASVGTSRGILTEPSTNTATATEIKHSEFATLALVNEIRDNIETAINELAYALDVLAEYFHATPNGARGDYSIRYDWDNSMLESSTETFAQLSELESRNLIRSSRLVAWVTGDSIEDAEAEIEEAQSKSADRMIGITNVD